MRNEAEIRELITGLEKTIPHLEERVNLYDDRTAEVPLMVSTNAVIVLRWMLGEERDMREFFGLNDR